jgi:hypothetical protein
VAVDLDRGPWTVDRGLWIADRGPRTVDLDRGPWTVDLDLDCGPPTNEARQDSRLWATITTGQKGS